MKEKEAWWTDWSLLGEKEKIDSVSVSVFYFIFCKIITANNCREKKRREETTCFWVNGLFSTWSTTWRKED
jgi:hypothetical protein